MRLVLPWQGSPDLLRGLVSRIALAMPQGTTTVLVVPMGPALMASPVRILLLIVAIGTLIPILTLGLVRIPCRNLLASSPLYLPRGT